MNAVYEVPGHGTTLAITFAITCCWLLAIVWSIRRQNRIAGEKARARRGYHEWVDHGPYGCLKDGHCPICDGGLHLCEVCNCTEGTLPTHCPGVRVPARAQDLIFKGVVDFRRGKWRGCRPPPKDMPSTLHQLDQSFKRMGHAFRQAGRRVEEFRGVAFDDVEHTIGEPILFDRREPPCT